MIPTDEEIQIESVIKRGYEPCHNCRPGIMDLVFISKNLSLFELPLWKLSSNQKALHCQHCKFTIPFIEIRQNVDDEDQDSIAKDIIDTTVVDNVVGSYSDSGCVNFFLDIIDPVPSLDDSKPIVPTSMKVDPISTNNVIEIHNLEDDYSIFCLPEMNQPDPAQRNTKTIFVIEENDYDPRESNLPIHYRCESNEDMHQMRSVIATPCNYLYKELIIITDNDEQAILSSQNPSHTLGNTSKEIIVVNEDGVVGHSFNDSDDSVDVHMIPVVNEEIPSLISSSSASGQTSKQSSSYYPISIDASLYGLTPWKVFSI